MKAKLEYLMANSGLRASQIAAMLGVKAPVLSHILSGRNQPNFSLTRKIIATFTDYSPLWWLGISDDPNATSCPTAAPSSDSSASSESELSNRATTPNLTTPTKSDAPSLFESAAATAPMVTTSQPHSEIERVIVFYRDKSFETFTPKK
ncbi:MAG: helix-turn-helix transcriptional regulator [Alistipes sp.]|nr:helix-turn-helix transcriptional regulator [Alistipes sp.]